jgi:hypothetical protein
VGSGHRSKHSSSAEVDRVFSWELHQLLQVLMVELEVGACLPSAPVRKFDHVLRAARRRLG